MCMYMWHTYTELANPTNEVWLASMYVKRAPFWCWNGGQKCTQGLRAGRDVQLKSKGTLRSLYGVAQGPVLEWVSEVHGVASLPNFTVHTKGSCAGAGLAV
eukprot:scaffold185188_cov20-Tisochrysis_lutea.AAC.3